MSVPAAPAEDPAQASRYSEASSGPAGTWISAALVTLLLLVASTPLAAEENATSVAVAALLSLAGGLSLRFPLIGTTVIGVTMTVSSPEGDVHIGTGALASPISIAACAARGHLLTAIGMATWHVIPSTAASVLRGDEGQYIFSQLMQWLLLQGAAVLGGTWGRSLVLRAGAERARRISDLAEQRRAIARELHDTGVRAMTQVVMLAENGSNRPAAQSGSEDFTRISATARQATEEMRLLLDMLRARDEQDAGRTEPVLDLPHEASAGPGEGSVPATLTDLLETTRLRLTADGFTVRTALEGEDRLPPATLALLTRCLAEIEANVIRHGERCVQVALLVEITDSADSSDDCDSVLGVDLVVLNGVAENGPQGLQGGAGLAGMRERLAAAGGTVETGREGRTFLTHIEIPGESDTE